MHIKMHTVLVMVMIPSWEETTLMMMITHHHQWNHQLFSSHTWVAISVIGSLLLLDSTTGDSPPSLAIIVVDHKSIDIIPIR